MRSTTIVMVAVLVCLAATAWAEDEFTYVFTTEIGEPIDLGNGMVANQITNSGFLIAKDPSHRLHLANQNCYGTSVGSGTAFENAGYCTVVPTAGDGGFWAAFEGDQSGGTWMVLRGGGAMQGTTGKGTYGPQLVTWPDGKGTNVITGTFKLP